MLMDYYCNVCGLGECRVNGCDVEPTQCPLDIHKHKGDLAPKNYICEQCSMITPCKVGHSTVVPTICPIDDIITNDCEWKEDI